MCWWCTNNSAPPSSSGSTTGVTGCAHSGSEVLLMDELGEPLAGVAVQCDVGAGWAGTTTDATGRICFADPPGLAVKIKAPELHEAAPGSGVTTASGKHIALGGTAP